MYILELASHILGGILIMIVLADVVVGAVQGVILGFSARTVFEPSRVFINVVALSIAIVLLGV